MIDGHDQSTPCLDPATIGAFIEGRLEPAARERVEAHLAGCAACYDLFIGTVQLQQELGLQDDRRRTRWPLVVMSGFGLAAAAALALFVATPDALQQWWRPDSRPELRALVAAMGNERPGAGRLTGGFPYGPRPAVMRGVASDVSPSIALAASELALRAAKDKTARPVAAAGTARLAAGQIDEAVTTLEEAVKLDPDLAFAWSDLSAAYLARHTRTGDTADATRAHDAAARALTLRPALPEALFNDAVAQEELGPAGRSIDAWQRYLAVDGSSPWAQEARDHLSRLQAEPRGGSGSN